MGTRTVLSGRDEARMRDGNTTENIGRGWNIVQV
jgi:hypothetical protein